MGHSCVAVLLIADSAVSGRLLSSPVSQAMVFVALGVVAGSRILGLVEAENGRPDGPPPGRGHP